MHAEDRERYERRVEEWNQKHPDDQLSISEKTGFAQRKKGPTPAQERKAADRVVKKAAAAKKYVAS